MQKVVSTFLFVKERLHPGILDGLALRSEGDLVALLPQVAPLATSNGPAVSFGMAAGPF